MPPAGRPGAREGPGDDPRGKYSYPGMTFFWKMVESPTGFLCHASPFVVSLDKVQGCALDFILIAFNLN